MLEGIAQPTPLGSNPFECGDFDDDVDTYLLGMPEAVGEQPARCLAALIDAGRDDRLQPGFWMRAQVANEP